MKGGLLMTKKDISKRISDVLDDISRLSNALYALDTTDIQRYPDNYEVLSTDAALRAESIVCRLRHLVYAGANIKKADYLHSAAAVMGIQIEYENGVVEITLPSLLPKRRQRQNSEFLLDPLYYALDKHMKTHAMPKYRHCVVCFSQIYNRDFPKRRIRDFDNLELKQILDVIAAFIMVDDTGILCDAYITTGFGDSDYTRVSVMDKNRFMEWLENRKNSIETITDFLRFRGCHFKYFSCCDFSTVIKMSTFL